MLQSDSSMVIAPASTGRDRSSNRALTATDHTNSGIRSGFMQIVADMKFTAPTIEHTPAKCTEKKTRSHYYYH